MECMKCDECAKNKCDVYRSVQMINAINDLKKDIKESIVGRCIYKVLDKLESLLERLRCG